MCVCVCVDPVLIYDKVEEGVDGFHGAMALFPDNFTPQQIQPDFSGEREDWKNLVRVFIWLGG